MKWTIFNSPGDFISCNGKDQWLSFRSHRIGGSDAAAVLGMSPYMSNEELWEIKTGLKKPEDISGKPGVKYGVNAEEHLREMFKLDFPDYKVAYKQYNLFLNPKYEFAHASLDGWIETPEGENGILEIKTATIKCMLQKEQWNDKIPDIYYCQILHYLMVTEWDFAIVKAQLKYEFPEELPYLQTRHYRIDRSDVEKDIELLAKEEERFWYYCYWKRRPPRKLPQI